MAKDENRYGSYQVRQVKDNDKKLQMSVFRTVLVKAISQYPSIAHFIMLTNNNLSFIVLLCSLTVYKRLLLSLDKELVLVHRSYYETNCVQSTERLSKTLLLFDGKRTPLRGEHFPVFQNIK